MNISGIRPNEGFYSYNSIKLNELRNQQIAASQAVKETQEEARAPQIEELPVEQNFTAMDYANTYNPNESYEMVGVDSDINSLDVEKAVSDLDKDKVLMQYQYFVGDKQKLATETNAGINMAEKSLRSGENFFL